MRMNKRDRAREWFYHDVDAASDVKCRFLLKQLGVAGYGVFWLIVEDLYQADGWELEYNPETIAQRFGCDAALVKRVVEDYELFDVIDGRFWSDAVKRRAMDRVLKEESEKRAAQVRIERARKGALGLIKYRETRKQAEDAVHGEKFANGINEHEASDKAHESAGNENIDGICGKRVQPPAMVIDSRELFAEANETPNIVVPEEELLRMWNVNFEGTAQFHRGLFLSGVERERARQALMEGYTLEQIEKAFKTARTDDYGWRMMDALKPSNIQMLLIKGERNAKAADKNKSGNDATHDLDEWYKLDERFSNNDDGSDD